MSKDREYRHIWEHSLSLIFGQLNHQKPNFSCWSWAVHQVSWPCCWPWPCWVPPQFCWAGCPSPTTMPGSVPPQPCWCHQAVQGCICQNSMKISVSWRMEFPALQFARSSTRGSSRGAPNGFTLKGSGRLCVWHLVLHVPLLGSASVHGKSELPLGHNGFD